MSREPLTASPDSTRRRRAPPMVIPISPARGCTSSRRSPRCSVCSALGSTRRSKWTCRAWKSARSTSTRLTSSSTSSPPIHRCARTRPRRSPSGSGRAATTCATPALRQDFAAGLSEPIKIVQAPRLTMVLYAVGNAHRQIFTDGRRFPAEFNLLAHYGYRWGAGSATRSSETPTRQRSTLSHPHSDQLRDRTVPSSRFRSPRRRDDVDDPKVRAPVHRPNPARPDRRRRRLRDVSENEKTSARIGEKMKAGRAGSPPAWPAVPAYFDSGSGLTWNFTSLLVLPLPPSAWNGARVA